MSKKYLFYGFCAWIVLMGIMYGGPWAWDRYLVATTANQPTLPEEQFQAYDVDGWTVAWVREKKWWSDEKSPLVGLNERQFMEVKKPMNILKVSKPTVFMTSHGEIFFNPTTRTVIFDDPFYLGFVTEETDSFHFGIWLPHENMSIGFWRNGKVILMDYDLALKE